MTRMPADQVAEHEARLRKEYDEYLEHRRTIRNRLLAELETQLDTQTETQLVGLSQKVRAAYDMGVPKVALRRATRAYQNPEAWAKVWDAAEDVAPVVDRGKRAVKAIEPFELVTDDPKDQGQKFIEAGKKATLIIRSGPDGIPWDEPVEIRLERKALRGPWVMDPAEEPWYVVDEEDGNRLVRTDIGDRIDEWGIDRVFEMYAPRKSK